MLFDENAQKWGAPIPVALATGTAAYLVLELPAQSRAPLASTSITPSSILQVDQSHSPFIPARISLPKSLPSFQAHRSHTLLTPDTPDALGLDLTSVVAIASNAWTHQGRFGSLEPR